MSNKMLERVFDIVEITHSRSVTGPFRILLRNGTINEEGLLVLDAGSLNSFNIPFFLDLVSKKIKVTWEVWELPVSISDPDSLDTIGITDEDLQISELSEKTTVQFDYPDKRLIKERILRLTSYGCRRDVHVSYLPCPYVEITLVLNDSEYAWCALLTPDVVFRASFSVRE